MTGGTSTAVPLDPATLLADIKRWGTELGFAGDTARIVVGQVSVSIGCEGEPTGFCSGTLTLSWGGRKSVTPFSVEAGADEAILVPLRVEAHAGHPARVSAIARTTQPRR